jgi:hypothetical protein
MLLATTLILVTLAAAAGLYARARTRVRVVHCPGSHAPAVVQLDAMDALIGPDHVGRCSEWPQRRDCAQACLSEIAHSPDGCLFQRILADWYKNKTCVYCCRRLPAVLWGEPRPGLRSPEGRLVHWNEVPPAEVFAVLDTHQPVCASCDLAESFRMQYPDRVVERPPRPEGRGLVEERRH